MVNKNMEFYKKVKPPTSSKNISLIVETIMTKGIKALKTCGQLEDKSEYNLDDLKRVKEKAIYYTNGEWAGLKNDSVVKFKDVKHTLFLRLYKKDVYNVLNKYLENIQDYDIPFDVKVIFDKDNCCDVYVYATNETLLINFNALESAIKNIETVRPFVLAGIINDSIGYMNREYNRGGKTADDFYEGNLINNVEESLKEAFACYYNLNKSAKSSAGVQWKYLLAANIAKNIYDEYKGIEYSKIESMYAPQYFGVTAKEFLDKDYLKKLCIYIAGKLDDFFEKKEDIKLPNSLYAILTPNKFSQIVYKLKVMVKHSDLKILEVPFTTEMEEKSIKCGQDEENISFKKETKKEFEKIDEELVYPKIESQTNEEYIYYSMWINNNLDRKLLFKGIEITFGDYFVRYVASYLSSIHGEDYKVLYDFLLPKRKDLISDLRNYGMDKKILTDEEIEFIIEKMEVIIAKIYPDCVHKKGRTF